MTKQELSGILSKMVENASRGTITTQYHLFGIKYSSEINDAKFKYLFKKNTEIRTVFA